MEARDDPREERYVIDVEDFGLYTSVGRLIMGRTSWWSLFVI